MGHPLPALCSTVVLVAGLGAAPAPPAAEVLYYPTAVGTKWVHVEERRNGRFVYTSVIHKSEVRGGVRVVTVHTVHDTGTAHASTIEVSPRGLREVANFDRRVDPAFPMLRLPHRPDDTWEADLFLNGGNRGKHVMTARGVEEVRVPAGTFKAIRVDWTTPNTEPVQRETNWYAPGVGLVRCTSAGSFRVLTSFTLGKD